MHQYYLLTILRESEGYYLLSYSFSYFITVESMEGIINCIYANCIFKVYHTLFNKATQIMKSWWILRLDSRLKKKINWLSTTSKFYGAWKMLDVSNWSWRMKLEKPSSVSQGLLKLNPGQVKYHSLVWNKRSLPHPSPIIHDWDLVKPQILYLSLQRVLWSRLEEALNCYVCK